MRIFSYRFEYEDFCIICQYSFDRRQTSELVVLPCNHVYHMFCAINWLKEPFGRMRCPICKRHAITGEEQKGDPRKELPERNPYGNTDYRRPLNFVCSKCKAKFRTMKDFARHCKEFNHNSRPKYACRTCHLVLTSFSDLYEHLEQTKHHSRVIHPGGPADLTMLAQL